MLLVSRLMLMITHWKPLHRSLLCWTKTGLNPQTLLNWTRSSMRFSSAFAHNPDRLVTLERLVLLVLQVPLFVDHPDQKDKREILHLVLLA
jgi:hypothetical protein